MLVLSRKNNEAILVGDHIRLVVVELRGNRVKLGIEAPAGVDIKREEIAQRIAQAIAPQEPEPCSPSPASPARP